ncbi:MAG: hypothetical protein ACTSXJ_01935 [Candidatus Baldrarchaeia archaeon]
MLGLGRDKEFIKNVRRKLKILSGEVHGKIKIMHVCGTAGQ